MGFLDFLRFSQRGLKVNLQYASCSSCELVCDVHAMVDEHIVAFENRLAIELDSGVSIQAIKCKDVSNAST